ncbi:MAG: hypothetical protein ACPGRZ_07640 [Alphaproteobacteria bacterium]
MSKPIILAAALAVVLGLAGPAAANEGQTTTVHLSDIKAHCKSLVLQFSGENVTDPNAIKSSKEGEKNCASYDPGTVVLGLSQMQYALELIGIVPHSR